MDTVKIGKYIAGKRKDLGMTQRQLAEKLGVSDKSVSKWERGICLPDVSLYSELCRILGISLNEFFASEDIPRENMILKSEENLIGVTADSTQKQKRLKAIIRILLLVSVLMLSVFGVFVYQKIRPQNYLAPAAKDSSEMEIVKLLAGPDGAYIYTFAASEKYKRLILYISEYRSGVLENKENMELLLEDTDPSRKGEILIVPDFSRFVVRTVIASDGSKLSTDIPVLENVTDRGYYGRSAVGIGEKTNIRYDEEQALLALIYDNDEMRIVDIDDFMNGQTDALSENDYVYFFSFKFAKE
ncbi:MAG: helix-turn-helix transcriptional regulator [Erysipelotrichaceae bacterium]|nr:helix-turn-helix transcriptional regulator [Erysipelotrichaceae bacterium]